LFILAVLSVVGGWLGTPWGPEHGWAYWIRTGEYHHAEANYTIMIVSTILALAGIGLAYLMYLKRSISYEKIAERAGVLYKLSYNKYYIDEIYLWFNHTVVDGLGRLLYWFDIYVIDGIVNGLGFFTR